MSGITIAAGALFVMAAACVRFSIWQIERKFRKVERGFDELQALSDRYHDGVRAGLIKLERDLDDAIDACREARRP